MIDSPDLLAFLKEEGVRSRNEELQLRADTNLSSYKGDYYGDEVDGRSKAVARDVAEVIDHMEVSVLRTFVSGDRVVEFEPLSQADEQAADDATEVMRRDFSRKGYGLLHDWFKEGNINILGIVKACTETKKVKRAHIVPKGMDTGEAEVVSREPAGVDPILGELEKVTVLADEIQFVDRLVPLEEFRFSPDAHKLEDAPYLAHVTIKTISDLIEMGFDPDEIDYASFDYAALETPLAQSRSTLNTFRENMDREGPLRQVMLYEEYVKYDLDEDGVAERLCVHRVGNTILECKETDYQPFRVYCPFPMPARIDGEALAEKVSDIQRINTALLRLGLDGLYANLAPGYLVNDSSLNENTIDDLLTVRPNRIVRYKGAIPPTPEQKQDVSGVAFQAIEFMIGQRESRTGVTRLNQGLDADALNKTATGTALMQAQGQQMEEYLARNFAEALAELMVLKYRLYKQYSPPIRMRVDGQYRMIDPSQWPDEMDIIIRVGLGTGKKDQRLQNRMLVLQIQQQIMMGRLPIVGMEQIYKSVAGIVRDASIGSPNDYVIDPSTLPPQPMPPTPEQMKVQGELQIAQMRAQAEQQLAAAKVQVAQVTAQADIEMNRQKLEAELSIAMGKAQIEQDLAQLKMQGIQIDHARAVQDANLSHAQAEHQAALANDKAAFEANLAHGKAIRDAQLADSQVTASAMTEARKAEAHAAIHAQDIHNKGQIAAANAELDRAKAEHQAQLDNDKAVFEANLAHRRAQHEAMLAEAKAQQEAALTAHKATADAAIKAGEADQKAQLNTAEAAHNAQLDTAKAAEEAQLERAKAEHEAQLAEDKAQFEASLALREQQFNEEMARREADRADAVAARDAQRGDHVAARNADRQDYTAQQNAVHKNRPGGDLSE